MKVKKTNLPTELLFEIVRFIPINIKWDNIRVSRNFDFFIHKFQKKWIVRLKNPDLIITKAKLISTFNEISEKLSSINVQDIVNEEFLRQVIYMMDGIYRFYRFYSINDEIDHVTSQIGEWPQINASNKTLFEIRKERVLQLIDYSISAIKISRSTDFFDWTMLSKVFASQLSIIVILTLPNALPQSPNIFFYGGLLLACTLIGYHCYKAFTHHH